ncbi:MAG TPA: glycine-rich protein, partial [Trebonia sp.]
MKPFRILPAVGAIGLIGGTLFVASGTASAAATPGAAAIPTTPCGATGTVSVTSCTYSATGTGTFTVPASVTTATFKLLGAQGGSSPGTAPGGLGGSVTATLSVTPGQVFQVNVGAHGSFNPSPGGIDNGSGGGGSSDVRTAAFALANRVLVA